MENGYYIFPNQTVLIISVIGICVFIILIVFLCYFKLKREKSPDYEYDKSPLMLSSFMSKSQSTKRLVIIIRRDSQITEPVVCVNRLQKCSL